MVKKFILQWHLSERCNLKCLHCYQENHKCVELKYEELLNILEQYKELLKRLNCKGHINLTGGEPLCFPYFFKILEEFRKDKDLYSFSILLITFLYINRRYLIMSAFFFIHFA